LKLIGLTFILFYRVGKKIQFLSVSYAALKILSDISLHFQLQKQSQFSVDR